MLLFTGMRYFTMCPLPGTGGDVRHMEPKLYGTYVVERLEHALNSNNNNVEARGLHAGD